MYYEYLMYQYQRYLGQGLSKAEIEKEDLGWIRLTLFLYAKDEEREIKNMKNDKLTKYK